MIQHSYMPLGVNPTLLEIADCAVIFLVKTNQPNSFFLIGNRKIILTLLPQSAVSAERRFLFRLIAFIYKIFINQFAVWLNFKEKYSFHKTRNTNNKSERHYFILRNIFLHKRTIQHLNCLISCMHKSVQIHLFDVFTCTRIFLNVSKCFLSLFMFKTVLHRKCNV